MFRSSTTFSTHCSLTLWNTGFLLPGVHLDEYFVAGRDQYWLYWWKVYEHSPQPYFQQSVVPFTAITYYVKNNFFSVLSLLMLSWKMLSEMLRQWGSPSSETSLWGWASKDSPQCLNSSPCLSSLHTSLYDTLLSPGPALPHYVPTPNWFSICSALSHHMKLFRSFPNCCERTSRHSEYTILLTGWMKTLQSWPNHYIKILLQVKMTQPILTGPSQLAFHRIGQLSHTFHLATAFSKKSAGIPTLKVMGCP